jgi:hypothetical protein
MNIVKGKRAQAKQSKSEWKMKGLIEMSSLCLEFDCDAMQCHTHTKWKKIAHEKFILENRKKKSSKRSYSCFVTLLSCMHRVCPWLRACFCLFPASFDASQPHALNQFGTIQCRASLVRPINNNGCMLRRFFLIVACKIQNATPSMHKLALSETRQPGLLKYTSGQREKKARMTRRHKWVGWKVRWRWKEPENNRLDVRLMAIIKFLMKVSFTEMHVRASDNSRDEKLFYFCKNHTATTLWMKIMTLLASSFSYSQLISRGFAGVFTPIIELFVTREPVKFCKIIQRHREKNFEVISSCRVQSTRESETARERANDDITCLT